MRMMRFFWVVMLLAVVSMSHAQDVETVVDSLKSNIKNGDVKEAVSNIKDAFKLKVASAEMMVGKWQYVEPAVYATKGNLLFKLAGNTVADELEKVLGEYIEKCNITPENTTFTFYKDGTFVRNVMILRTIRTVPGVQAVLARKAPVSRSSTVVRSSRSAILRRRSVRSL